MCIKLFFLFYFPEHSYSQTIRLPLWYLVPVSSWGGTPSRGHLNLCGGCYDLLLLLLPQFQGLNGHFLGWGWSCIAQSQPTTCWSAPHPSVKKYLLMPLCCWAVGTLSLLSSLEQFSLLPRTLLSFVGKLRTEEVPALAESVPVFCQVRLGLRVSVFCPRPWNYEESSSKTQLNPMSCGPASGACN